MKQSVSLWQLMGFAVTSFSGTILHFLYEWLGDFWCVKLRGIVLGIILIPVIFYTYNGVVGKSPDWFNIAIFFITAAITYIYETHLLKSEKEHRRSPKPALATLGILAFLFVIFTFLTPEIGIFKDPLTGTYGI